jgi:hypothetical protein
MADSRGIRTTAGLALGSMVLLFGMLAAWLGLVTTDYAPTLLAVLVLVCGAGGLGLLVLAGRRVVRRLRAQT